MFRVGLGRFGRVMGGVMKMALRRVRVMRGGFVVSRFVMPGRFHMVVSCVLVVFGCLAVMFGCLL